MSLKDYWTQPTDVQDKLIVAASPKPSYMRPKGCKCKVADSAKCWEKKFGYRPGNCSCSCHYDQGEDW